jgi:hypothetical protein
METVKDSDPKLLASHDEFFPFYIGEAEKGGNSVWIVRHIFLVITPAEKVGVCRCSILQHSTSLGEYP